MRIGIDTRALLGKMWFGGGSRTGVGRYTYELIEGLTAADHTNQYVLFFNSFKVPNLDPINDILTRSNVTLATWRVPNKIFDRSARFLHWPRIDQLIKGGIDIYLNPHINIAPLSQGPKCVQVVHDLTFEVYPESFNWRKRYWNWAQAAAQSCRRAARVVALSESTRLDIMERYGISDDKISVVYPGADMPVSRERIRAFPTQHSLPASYILFLGTLQPRKNLESLIKAYTSIATLDQATPDLVIAGIGGWSWGSIMKAVQASAAKKRIHLLGYVPEDELSALYARAALFVWPSFYEGFGFPVLEAMNFGVPVVASATSSLSEIAGCAAVLINPHDVHDLERAMREVLSDSALRGDLIDKGREQARKFTWARTIDEMLGVIRSV